MTVTEADLVRLTMEVLAKIRDMQVNGYSFGSEYQGRLPMVSSFEELHDHFDANLGWSDELDEADVSVFNEVSTRVDKVLRRAAGALCVECGGSIKNCPVKFQPGMRPGLCGICNDIATEEECCRC